MDLAFQVANRIPGALCELFFGFWARGTSEQNDIYFHRQAFGRDVDTNLTSFVFSTLAATSRFSGNTKGGQFGPD